MLRAHDPIHSAHSAAGVLLQPSARRGLHCRQIQQRQQKPQLLQRQPFFLFLFLVLAVLFIVGPVIGFVFIRQHEFLRRVTEW